MGARCVEEFATSLGSSSIDVAVAVRDNGGVVRGSEIVPAKVRATWRNLGGPLDSFLMDGSATCGGASLALQVLEVVAPQLRTGAMILNGSSEPGCLEYVRSPTDGFLALSLPYQRTSELSVKVC